MRCTCVSAGRKCGDCYPSRAGNCQNQVSGKPTQLQVNLLANLDTSAVDADNDTSISGKTSAQPTPSQVSLLANLDTSAVGASIDTSMSGNAAGQPTPSQVSLLAGLDTSEVGARVGANVPHPSGGSGSSWGAALHTAYESVVAWRRNLFNIPLGSAGSQFVDELTRLVEGFNNATSLRPIAWKAVTVACHLLLQRPHDSKIMSNFSDHLRRRLEWWKAGRVGDLLEEGECIQIRLAVPAGKAGKSTDGSERTKSDIKFSNLVFSGKIQSAIRYLTSDTAGGVMHMSEVVDRDSGSTVEDVLRQKHPPASEPPESALLTGDTVPINNIVFQKITPELIRRIARQMQGSSGPSGLDADAWCRMLTCYRKSSDKLCAALASFAQCLCTEELDPGHLAAFTSARLIPLDKQPGVRPIAVGEAHRRLVCRAIMRIVEPEVLRATAPYQICIGVPSACEAGVHAMQELFAQEETEGMLFVDASNAFNSLNRKAALHNAAHVCPAVAQVFRNTYGCPIRLFVTGGGEIYSTEGTCQGDPLAMALYAVATVPLINELQKANPSVRQGWYADDDAVGGRLRSLLSYWEDVRRLGPGYGYFPNPSKSVLLVKPEYEQEAQRLFASSGLLIKSDGNRHLGGKERIVSR